LAELRKRLPARSQDALTRLPIDRSFVVKGFGTVVTGTFVGGTIRLSQTLTIEPGNRSVRVRGIQIHGHPEDTAYAGSRVALNLAGIDASEVRRGQTLIQPSAVAAVDTFDVEATLLPGVAELKHRAGVHLYAYASETVATVSLYEGYQPVKPGETRLMRMRLDRPVVLLPGDRFVLRQSSPAMTIGGGRILDTRPLSNLRKAACLNWLLDLKDAPLEQQFVLRIARRGTAGLSLNALSAETGLTIEAIVRITEGAEHHQSVVRLSNNLLMTREALDMTARLVISELQSRTQNAAVPGLKRAELKTHAKLSAEVFDFILEKLYRERKLDIRGDLVCSSDKADEVTGRDRGLLAAIAADFEAAGLACPAPEDVAKKLAIDHREMRRLITQLLHDKTLVKLGNNDLFVHHDALAKLKGQISSLRGKMLDIASFKQLTGLSRKYAIPLLEHLDRERITRKQDEHSRLVL
jgi:selenocysteine-specific elongation factor